MFKDASVFSKGDATHIACIQLSPPTPSNFFFDERGLYTGYHKSTEERREPFLGLGKLVALGRPQEIGCKNN